jgi:hypothetical protein
MVNIAAFFDSRIRSFFTMFAEVQKIRSHGLIHTVATGVENALVLGTKKYSLIDTDKDSGTDGQTGGQTG